MHFDARVPAMTVRSIVAPWHRMPVALARSALVVRDARARAASAATLAAANAAAAVGVHGAIAPAAAAGQPWELGTTS